MVNLLHFCLPAEASAQAGSLPHTYLSADRQDARRVSAKDGANQSVGEKVCSSCFSVWSLVEMYLPGELVNCRNSGGIFLARDMTPVILYFEFQVRRIACGRLAMGKHLPAFRAETAV